MKTIKLILPENNTEVMVDYNIETGCPGDNITPGTSEEIIIENVFVQRALGFFIDKLDYETLKKLGIIEWIHDEIEIVINN